MGNAYFDIPYLADAAAYAIDLYGQIFILLAFPNLDDISIIVFFALVDTLFILWTLFGMTQWFHRQLTTSRVTCHFFKVQLC